MRKLPLPLLAALGLAIAAEIAQGVHALVGDERHGGAGWTLAFSGIGIAITCLQLPGLRALARRTTGTTSLGARIAAGGTVGQVLITLSWLGLWCYAMTRPIGEYPETGWKIVQGASSLVTLVTMIGFGVATRRSVLAGVAVVVSVATHPPWFVGRWLYNGLDLGARTGRLFEIGLRLVLLGTMLACAVVACRDGEDASEPPRAAAGLRVAGRWLWVRVIAAAAMAIVTLLVATSTTGPGARGLFDLFRAMTLLAVAVEAVAVTGFAYGALGAVRAKLSDLPRGPLLAGAACALWLAGMLTARLPYQYRMLYGADEGMSGLGSLYGEFATALSSIGPIVGAAGVTLVLISIASLARRRGMEAMRENTVMRTGAFVVLMLGSIAIEHWVAARATEPDGPGLVLFVTLLAAAGALYANLIAAKLCAEASQVVQGDAGIPTAKLVS